MVKECNCKDITSVTKLKRCGYGVGAKVKLAKPYINKLSGENIGPPVGTTGKVVGAFGREPTIKWSKPGKYGSGAQVVDTCVLKLVKRSGKADVILSASLSQLEKEAGKWTNFEIYQDKGKVTLTKTESVMDEAGYEVGDATYELTGKKKKGKVEFTSSRVRMGSVPRNQRSTIREYFESQSAEDIFGLHDIKKKRKR